LRYFPIFVDLEGRDVLIAGGGEKALQKLRLLTKTTARIRVVAADISSDIEALGQERPLVLQRRCFEAADLEGAAVVFAANDTQDADKEVAEAVRGTNIPFNMVDAPRESTFIMPAIVDRDPVVVAIGTEGAAPILAREVKARLEAWLPAAFGSIAARAMALRQRVQETVSDPVLRRRTWERLLQGRWRAAVLAGDEAVAAHELERQLAAAAEGASPAGSVALIGCGPGEPDLITLKAQQRLQEADVLVVDRLVNPEILEYARRDAIRIDVGKTPAGPSAQQDEINRILVREALKGHRVARLKGGDAFIFGRAAEEMAAVRAAGIPVEVVPGITSAHACAASVGLPLTLRRQVRQFSVITGASADSAFDLDWRALGKPGQAFAIYMGVREAPRLQERLLAEGAAPETSVVIVENGTLASERSIATRLSDLSDAIAAKRITGPAIIFVGLDWQSAGLSRPDGVEDFQQEASRSPSTGGADLAASLNNGH
jgi:uroporphyrin-III C-methyltransferase / precorrin-2 dehydrogenase / sirohydrochlorin ferrochelatase